MLTISFIVIIRPFNSIVENDSNENNFDINHSKDVSNRKKFILILKAFKEKKIIKSDLIDIVEIDVLAYYYLVRNKENKLFFLIMNEIYDIFIEFFEIRSQTKRDNRISINKLCLCDSAIKYKKCYEFYTFKNSQINNIKILIL